MKPPMDYPWAIELVDFAQKYRTSGPGRSAVGGLTLRLARGQILGLIGPNGSGKSTTLKALAGLLTPTAGGCRIFAGNTAVLPPLNRPRFFALLWWAEFLASGGTGSARERGA
jgi:ABC-type hemin transport system ATPase subunit